VGRAKGPGEESWNPEDRQRGGGGSSPRRSAGTGISVLKKGGVGKRPGRVCLEKRIKSQETNCSQSGEGLGRENCYRRKKQNIKGLPLGGQEIGRKNRKEKKVGKVQTSLAWYWKNPKKKTGPRRSRIEKEKKGNSLHSKMVVQKIFKCQVSPKGNPQKDNGKVTVFFPD